LRQKGIEHPERLGGFVNSVCNNVLFETFRGQNRYTPLNAESAEFHGWVDDRIELDEPLINEQRKRLVDKGLSRLRSRDVKLLRLIFLDEMDREKAGQKLGISQTCLRVVLHRAIVRFRKELTGLSPSAAKRSDSGEELDWVKQQACSVHYDMGHIN